MSLKVTLEHWARCTRALLHQNACGKVGHCTTPSNCSLKHFLLNHLAHDLSTFCAKNFFLTSNNLDILLGTRFLLDNVAEKKVYGHISSILFPYFWEDKSGGRVPKTALFPHHLHTSLCPACSKWGGRQRKSFLQFFFLSRILQIRSLFEGGVAIFDFLLYTKHVE